MAENDHLPDFATMLALPASRTAERRRSPRKVKRSDSSIVEGDLDLDASFAPDSQMRSIYGKSKTSPIEQVSLPTPSALSWSNVPVLPKCCPKTTVSASSKNGLARSPQQQSIGLTHVDSLLLPLSQICLDAKPRLKQASLRAKEVAKSRTSSKPTRSPERRNAKSSSRSTATVSKLILNGAACADDFADSLTEDGEDEDTDLSGFVVDDDVEPSIYESSSDSEVDKRAKKKPSASPRKGRLQQGARYGTHPDVISFETASDRTTKPVDNLHTAFRDLQIGSKQKERPKQDIQIVDLTSSPARTQGDMSKVNVNTGEQSTNIKNLGDPINLLNDFEAILKFSPPKISGPATVPTKLKMGRPKPKDEQVQNVKTNQVYIEDAFTTPPATPPASLSKLKSPSKLLSPSKRAAQIPRSPHRQSIDGFWDLEVVNTWYDTYSPKKAPITSPRKNRFLDWLDSGIEDDETPTGLLENSSDSLPSPCSSPRKPKSAGRSSEKVEKQQALNEKRAAKIKKQDFESRKEKLAYALMLDLDDNITSSKLSTLSSSTGGVQIIWSKTLRSTAGRANWRRTIVKPTGSPVKGSSVPDGCKAQHYASIELATKVIDTEARLVNTLAHEFCHLANFMVSNVRDQPHGASFKAWAVKVTKYLRGHENPVYRTVEVTTKHSYIIDHKYLWVCAGRETLGLTKDVSEAKDGCGAEYGRHSKSIDVDKHRCGRCKGLLVQVRPEPRKANPERSSPRKALFQKTPFETMTEVVNIVGLSD